ncbi:MAG: hypothetical protein JF593_08815 [Novosphingobium sp.]|nr:hypothetical protein [Novosphingobium sp.]
MRRLTKREPARYLGVATACAVLNNVLLIAGDRAGLGYAGLMALLGLVSGTIAYLLHARITFAAPLTRGGYGRFMTGVLLAIPVAFACLAFFKSLLALPMWAAAPAATVAMFVFNYASARVAILRRLLPRRPEAV